QAPTGAQAVAGPFGHALSKLPELLKDLTNNSIPGGPMDAQAPLGIVINLAGSQTTQAAKLAVVEFVGDQFDFQAHGHLLHQVPPLLFVQRGLEVLHAPLDGAVVARVTRRTV